MYEDDAAGGGQPTTRAIKKRRDNRPKKSLKDTTSTNGTGGGRMETARGAGRKQARRGRPRGAICCRLNFSRTCWFFVSLPSLLLRIIIYRPSVVGYACPCACCWCFCLVLLRIAFYWRIPSSHSFVAVLSTPLAPGSYIPG